MFSGLTTSICMDVRDEMLFPRVEIPSNAFRVC